MRVFREGGAWLVWTAAEWELAREQGVVGVPVLTAPAFPQQSRFLGLPVEVMACEARFLHEKAGARLVEAKFKDRGEVAAAQLGEQYKELVVAFDEAEFEAVDVDPPEVDSLLYKTYCVLRERGIWVISGNKYGADFAVYKSSPGSSHAFGLVWCCRDKIDTRWLIRTMRIAEASNKEMIVAVSVGDGVRLVSCGRWKGETEPEQEQESGNP